MSAAEPPREIRSVSSGSPGSFFSLPTRWPAVAWARRHDPRFQTQAALATIFAITLGAFLHVVEDYLDSDPIVRWDVEFSRWLHVHSNGALLSFFKIATLAGNVAFLALLTVGVGLYLLRRRARNEAALVLSAALGIEVLNAGLKLLFHRPRPELAYVHLDTYSFPSGHAAGSTAIYAVILYVFDSRSGVSGRARVLTAVGFVLLAALIAFSRLYLEVHYLSDVLAGCSLGAAWASGCLFLYEAKRSGTTTRSVRARRA